MRKKVSFYLKEKTIKYIEMYAFTHGICKSAAVEQIVDFYKKTQNHEFIINVKEGDKVEVKEPEQEDMLKLAREALNNERLVDKETADNIFKSMAH